MITNPATRRKIFSHLAKAKVVVNDIIQTEVNTEKANMSFTVGHSDLNDAKTAIEQIKDEVGCDNIFVRDDIAEVSIIGVGMRTHYGVADKMFGALAKAKINIDSITTSEIRISCIVDKAQGEKALDGVAMRSSLISPPTNGASKAIATSQARHYAKICYESPNVRN